MSHREEPEQNLFYREKQKRKVGLMGVAPVSRHTTGLGHLLSLKCIVGASVIQVMTETADHQCQYLRVGQHILETGCL